MNVNKEKKQKWLITAIAIYATAHLTIEQLRQIKQHCMKRSAYEYVANPFVQPNGTDLNWYGSGDVKQDNVIKIIAIFLDNFVKLGEKEFIWFLNLHHLVTDASSSVLIYNRMVDIYTSFKN